MPTDDERRKADELDRMVIGAIRDMSMQLGKTVLEVSQDTTAQLARFREDVHRSIMGIQRRLVEFEARADVDDRARKTRQEHLDAVLDSIRKHQRVRMAIEVALIVAALAYYLGGR